MTFAEFTASSSETSIESMFGLDFDEWIDIVLPSGTLGRQPWGTIILSAVLTPRRDESVPNGSLIVALAPAWLAIMRKLTKQPERIYTIPPRKLEELIAAAYDMAGWDDVILTSWSGDFGRDVIAVRNYPPPDNSPVRIIVQVKAYRPTRAVDANDIRALLGVLLSDPSATKGIVSTTSHFAPRIKDDPYIRQFIPYRLELIDGGSLLEWFRAVSGLAKLDQIDRSG